ncbi:hypothetical protein GCM10009000_048140 [Halobacterium noricense]|uniref:Gluconate:H+ symporter, GntP family n=1 Tax=Haladaptatus pallidirubidus TaxID=1008152 RepID=A0AAV3UED3_9EURY
MGTTILIGLAVAIPSALVAGIFYGRWINARLDIPLRDSMDTSGAELEDIAQRSTSQLPGVFEASLPILLAVVLVASNTVVDTFLSDGTTFSGLLGANIPLVGSMEVGGVTGFLGDPNFALTMAAVAAALTYRRMRAMSDEEWSDELTESLKSGGNIAAITAAGGAFGAMLAAAGIGDYIADALAGLGIGLLVTAWLIAAAVRIAQGSATVAMLTTAGIVSGSGLVASLSVHPAYLVMAIGAGGNIFSWYNDSRFWLVKEIGGLTQAETLKTWTALMTIISVTGIITVLIASSVFPLT